VFNAATPAHGTGAIVSYRGSAFIGCDMGMLADWHK